MPGQHYFAGVWTLYTQQSNVPWIYSIQFAGPVSTGLFQPANYGQGGPYMYQRLDGADHIL
jgi:hypothetical protein